MGEREVMEGLSFPFRVLASKPCWDLYAVFHCALQPTAYVFSIKARIDSQGTKWKNLPQAFQQNYFCY